MAAAFISTWDQQWSLRLQQIGAFETDMLEFDDIFDGSKVLEEKVSTFATQMKQEIARIEALGGAASQSALEYMKERLVLSNAARVEAIERGEEIRVGVNAYTETEPSPLTQGESQFVSVDGKAEREQIKRLKAWKQTRDPSQVAGSLKELRKCASEDRNIMPASIACAKAGVTTGEWAECLRNVFGEYRAPTGISMGAPTRNDERILELRDEVERVSKKLGRRLTLLVAKPGLDGHSNGAEQITIRARDAGMNVIYNGIRFSPEEIVAAAQEVRPHVIGISILSGSHVPLVQTLMQQLRAAGLTDVNVVAGGIIPAEDERLLKDAGVSAVFSPKDYDLNAIMRAIIRLVTTDQAKTAQPWQGEPESPAA